jgi:hypothetical protein
MPTMPIDTGFTWYEIILSTIGWLGVTAIVIGIIAFVVGYFDVAGVSFFGGCAIAIAFLIPATSMHDDRVDDMRDDAAQELVDKHVDPLGYEVTDVDSTGETDGTFVLVDDRCPWLAYFHVEPDGSLDTYVDDNEVQAEESDETTTTTEWTPPRRVYFDDLKQLRALYDQCALTG